MELFEVRWRGDGCFRGKRRWESLSWELEGREWEREHFVCSLYFCWLFLFVQGVLNVCSPVFAY